MGKLKRYEFLMLVLLVFSTFFISFYNWNDVELNVDDFARARKIYNLISHSQVEPPDVFWNIDYLWMTPFSVMDNAGKFSIRLNQSFFIVLTVLLTYLFTKRYFNKRVAILTCIFLIFLPFFIHNKITVIPILPFFTMLIFYSLFLSYLERKPKYLVTVSILSGLALSFSMLFLYTMLSILIIFLLFFRHFHYPSKRLMLYYILFFLLSGFPFLLGIIINFNMKSISQFFPVNYYGHNNLAFFTNFIGRSGQMGKLISETALPIPAAYYVARAELKLGGMEIKIDESKLPWLSFNLIIFIISSFFALLKREKKVVYILFFMLIFLYLSTIVPRKMSAVHLMAILPLPISVIAWFLDEIKRNSTYVFQILLVTLLSINLLTTIVYASFLKKVEKTNAYHELKTLLGNHSYVIFDLPTEIFQMVEVEKKWKNTTALCNFKEKPAIDETKPLPIEVICENIKDVLNKIIEFKDSIYVFQFKNAEENVAFKIFMKVINELNRTFDLFNVSYIGDVTYKIYYLQ